MFDINGHLSFVKKSLSKASKEKKTFFATWCFKLSLAVPDALDILKRELGVEDSGEAILHKLCAMETADYCEKLQASLDDMDEYAEDFVGLDGVSLYVISGLEHAANVEIPACAENAINLLDYFEQFSENADFWNGMLKKEVLAQRQFIQDLLDGKPLTMSSHRSFLDKVAFPGV